MSIPNLPPGAHLFPISFTQMKLMVRAARLVAMQIKTTDPDGAKELHEVANYLEDQLNIAYEKEKEMERNRVKHIESIRKAHFN